MNKKMVKDDITTGYEAEMFASVLHPRSKLRFQLEVCRLANMSVAASLASQNALGVACKDN